MNVFHKFMPFVKKARVGFILFRANICEHFSSNITMCVDAEKSEVHAGIFI